jgi:hypothetical protein
MTNATEDQGVALELAAEELVAEARLRGERIGMKGPHAALTIMTLAFGRAIADVAQNGTHAGMLIATLEDTIDKNVIGHLIQSGKETPHRG